MSSYQIILVGKKKMVKTVKNLTNIKLTESDADGIWLHFEAEGLKAGILLDTLSVIQSDGIVAATIQNWAREQLDKRKVAHRRFYLKQKYSTLPGTRPSPQVDGGY